MERLEFALDVVKLIFYTAVIVYIIKRWKK